MYFSPIAREDPLYSGPFKIQLRS